MEKQGSGGKIKNKKLAGICNRAKLGTGVTDFGLGYIRCASNAGTVQ